MSKYADADMDTFMWWIMINALAKVCKRREFINIFSQGNRFLAPDDGERKGKIDFDFFFTSPQLIDCDEMKVKERS